MIDYPYSQSNNYNNSSLLLINKSLNNNFFKAKILSVINQINNK